MGIDSSSKDVLYALVVLLMAALALVFSQGLRALKGTAELVRRARKSGESDEDWLLGHAIRPGCKQILPGLRIQLTFSAAAVKQWQADEPPPLAADGPSHLWGWIPRSLCPDIVIRPEPTHICACCRLIAEETYETFLTPMQTGILSTGRFEYVSKFALRQLSSCAFWRMDT